MQSSPIQTLTRIAAGAITSNRFVTPANVEGVADEHTRGDARGLF